MNSIYDFEDKFDILDQNFAHTILLHDFPEVYEQLTTYLKQFELTKTEITTAGGNESAIPKKIKKFFLENGWVDEYKFEISKMINGKSYDSSSYKIDLYHPKFKIAFDVEWNSKDSVFNRDLSNFKILHENNAINLAIIFTRTHEGIMSIAKDNGLGQKYGASTTNMVKLREKLQLGILGKCPFLAIGIDKGCYNPDL